MRKAKVNKKLIIICTGIAVVLATAAVLFFVLRGNGETTFHIGKDNTEIKLSIASQEPVKITEGLELTSVSDYTGLYLEDGSDSLVKNILAITLKNTSDKDLQLARIYVDFEGFTAEFEATNLPSDESVVLLEKSSRPFVSKDYLSIRAENVVYFEEKMTPIADVLEISGNGGNMVVKNISDKAVEGEIYIYYKNYSAESYFGGITYRTVVNDDIAAGESVSVLTSHFAGEQSRVVNIDIIE